MKREPQYLYTGTDKRAPYRSPSWLTMVSFLAFGAICWAGGTDWGARQSPDTSGLVRAVDINTVAYDRLRDELANVAGVCSISVDP